MYQNERGQVAVCCVCLAAAPFSCLGCERDVCDRHVAFIEHDCSFEHETTAWIGRVDAAGWPTTDAPEGAWAAAA